MKRERQAGFAHRNLPLLLLQAREKVMERFRPILQTHGLSEQQWRIIRALSEADDLEPRQIGEICALSSPSLAGMLARMDNLGLVVRERLAHDQRRVRVRLTAKSRRLAARIAPLIEQTYKGLERELGTDLVAGLYRNLDEILAVSLRRGTARTAGRRIVPLVSKEEK